jgi:hypothetical protein
MAADAVAAVDAAAAVDARCPDIVVAADTRLSGCKHLRAYSWRTGGRGLSSRRRRGRDAFLAAGVGQGQRSTRWNRGKSVGDTQRSN